MDELDEAIGKLSAAALQLAPSDDQIIAGHVRDSVALLLKHRHGLREQIKARPEQTLLAAFKVVRELVDDIRCAAMNYHGRAATSDHVIHDIIKCAQIKSGEAMTVLDRLLTDADNTEPEPLDNNF